MLIMYRLRSREIIVYFYRWVVIVSQSIEGWDWAKEGGCWLRNQQSLHKENGPCQDNRALWILSQQNGGIILNIWGAVIPFLVSFICCFFFILPVQSNVRFTCASMYSKYMQFKRKKRFLLCKVTMLKFWHVVVYCVCVCFFVVWCQKGGVVKIML